MIKLEKTQVVGLEPAIRGMRNPMNSWAKSDSVFDIEPEDMSDGYYYNTLGAYDIQRNYLRSDKPRRWGDDKEYAEKWALEWNGNWEFPHVVGPNDLDLMKRLAKNGPVHAKYRRMIIVYVDITAPLYWWKEFDTYKVGTVANSCSTMHKIQAKEFTLEDFSHEHLLCRPDPETFEDGEEIELDKLPWLAGIAVTENGDTAYYSPKYYLQMTCDILNRYRKLYLETKDKKYWWQMIQLLPSSYNQKRTVMLNYEVLAGIYPMRKDHKLDEWHTFCDWIRELPYSELITGELEVEA